MKRKFKDQAKKRRFLKELLNRWQLTQIKDKHDKLPIDYETDPDIRNYYQDIFKPKLKVISEKEHHSKIKEKDKDTNSPSNLAKEKEHKKKQREEEQKAVAEEEVGEED